MRAMRNREGWKIVKGRKQMLLLLDDQRYLEGAIALLGSILLMEAETGEVEQEPWLRLLGLLVLEAGYRGDVARKSRLESMLSDSMIWRKSDSIALLSSNLSIPEMGHHDETVA